jgi:hypothetical protein
MRSGAVPAESGSSFFCRPSGLIHYPTGWRGLQPWAAFCRRSAAVLDCLRVAAVIETWVPLSRIES